MSSDANLLEQGRHNSQEDEVLLEGGDKVRILLRSVILDNSSVVEQQSPSPLLHSPLVAGPPHRQPRFRWQTIGSCFVFVLASIALVIHWSFSAFSPKVGVVPPAIAAPVKLILLSIDGARPEYFTRSLTPAFSEWEEEGVRAESLLSQFPVSSACDCAIDLTIIRISCLDPQTKTFPNHYTIVTGLYPQSHGEKRARERIPQ